MLNTRNLLALLTVTTAGLAACEPLFVDFDGYREYPPDSGAGSGNGGSGNGGSGNGGSTSGGDGGSAAGGSGNSGGDGGSAAGGSGNSGGNAGSGNAAGDGGSAGSGGTSATCSQSVSDGACNDCLQANCCNELEACPPGTECDTYRKCVTDNCWDAPDIGPCIVQCNGGVIDQDWYRLYDCACNDSSDQCRAACQKTVGCGAPSQN